ncbi:MAG TPA: NADP-dependent oxidoreductase [Candidatus Limnocylindrales bacterium]|nr:NADP-dependent oxidoreductase [Candidatus Limnocylindrales bacterium]
MKAARIHQFGAPEVVVIDDLSRPNPDKGEILVGVKAAGVGPWDALIREGKSKVSPRPPLTLGSDLSGVVETIGPGVADFRVGDEVYGVTNAHFCGAHAEFALASAGMVARKPRRLNHVEAASVPVVAVTAWQMLFEYAKVVAGQSVLILGAGGNVGAYAVQLAASTGLDIVAIVGPKDVELVRNLGAKTVLVDQKAIPQVDVVIDTVGGETLEHSFGKVKSGGVLVSVVSTKPLPQRPGVRSVFFYADVTTLRLNVLTKLFEEEKLSARVGSILPLQDARTAHYMLGGAPHKPGKIVLEMAA